MKTPVFVVLKKYFYSAHGVDTPFTSDGGDILLFGSYEEAKKQALKWCCNLAEQVNLLCDVGELHEAACQIDNLVMQCVGHGCHDVVCVLISAEIYQKYVL